MRNAWVENGAVRDICDGDPTKLFTADIAAHFTVSVPDNVMAGATLVGGVWTNPTALAPVTVPDLPPVAKVCTQLEFLNRFTDVELVGIYTAAKASVAIEVFLAKFNAATSVDLHDQRTIDGIHGLQAAGLLTAGRGAAILA